MGNNKQKRNSGVKLILGDSLQKLRDLPTSTVDAVVTDPPYFLTNSGGSGFMGKEWDSLSVGNAFAESVLRSLSPVWLLAEANTAHENANTKTKESAPARFIHALFVQKNSIGPSPKLSLSTFSVQESVLTRDEVLALSSALCPSLTIAFESQPENVLYVINPSFIGTSATSIAREIALRLVTESVCEDLKILRSLMDEQKMRAAIEETTGSECASKFISATSLDVKNVESIVAEKRYSATTLLPINLQKIIQWTISSRSVRNAMATFMVNPGNIQVLSERFHYEWAKEVFRVLKPGAHILAFAGTRTYHPLANAIQYAGFEIRDQVQWLYGSGFPKSLDVSKAIDKAAGAKRETYQRPAFGGTFSDDNGTTYGTAISNTPATPDAVRWQGWGTALKPANEPIVLARKPLERGLTVAQNVLRWGVGAINVDASRIATDEKSNRPASQVKGAVFDNKGNGGFPEFDISKGRWPANCLFDESAAAVLDEQSGTLKTGGAGRIDNPVAKSEIGFTNKRTERWTAGDSGGASRFFYVAKASKRERNAGLEGMPLREKKVQVQQSEGRKNHGTTDAFPVANFHPTVKPIKLMEYLVRMITPNGGVVLDPFMGSGSTGVACERLGFSFIGIERESDYLEIARRRIEHAIADAVQEAEDAEPQTQFDLGSPA